MKKIIVKSLTLILCLCALICVGTACKHEHAFNQQIITDAYIASSATCTEKATYYYSCDCGEKGTLTFANGEALGHEFTDYVSDNNATYDSDGTKTAICNRDNCSETDTIIDVGTKLENSIKFKTLTVTGTKVVGVVPNSTENFSFLDEIESKGNATYIVTLDIFGYNPAPTKIVPLSVGDNLIYVFELLDGELSRVFEVVLRRRPMYSVAFNTNGVVAVNSQIVEEGFTAVEPEIDTIICGYTFCGWDFDFSTPIADNVVVNAKWMIEEGLEIFNFTSTETTCVITGLKDATVTDVVIPDCVTSIGYSAFYNCSSLTSITIPNTVTSIGSSAFSGCSSLSSIIVDEDNTTYKSIDGNLYSKNGTTLIQYAIGKTDSSFTIPNHVTSIGGWAFSNCSSLASITIPNSVTSIGGWAFDGCSIKNATIPTNTIMYLPKAFLKTVIINGGTSIGSDAFYNCSSLTSITIPDSVTSIGSGAFSNCSSLEIITLPFVGLTANSTSNTHFGYIFGARYYYENYYYIPSSLKTVVVTGGTSIGDYAFYECSSLTSVTIGNSVTSIGSSAFRDCSLLTSVTIGNSVTSIGSSAFLSCDSLEIVVIGNSVTSIGSYAFYGCSSLESITIPNSVTSIGFGAFYYSSRLTIYCQAVSKPGGWDIDWNQDRSYSYLPVVWGYKGN